MNIQSSTEVKCGKDIHFNINSPMFRICRIDQIKILNSLFSPAIIFVMSGTLSVKWAEMEVEVVAGRAGLIHRCDLVDYSFDIYGGNFDLMIFSVSDELLRDFIDFSEINIKKADLLSAFEVFERTLPLHDFVRSVEPFFEEVNCRDGQLLSLKIMELLYLLHEQNTNICAQLLKGRVMKRENLEKVIHDHLLTPMPLTELASRSGRSLSTFKRDFFQIYNSPPSQWIKERRLQKAKELILGSNMSVREVCETLGFDNVAHFSRMFKSQFGHSPNANRTV